MTDNKIYALTPWEKIAVAEDYFSTGVWGSNRASEKMFQEKWGLSKAEVSDIVDGYRLFAEFIGVNIPAMASRMSDHKITLAVRRKMEDIFLHDNNEYKRFCAIEHKINVDNGLEKDAPERMTIEVIYDGHKYKGEVQLDEQSS